MKEASTRATAGFGGGGPGVSPGPEGIRTDGGGTREPTPSGREHYGVRENLGCVVVEEGATAGWKQGVAGEVGRLWGFRKKGG